jgi:cytochrome c-type biogenesis protein
VNFSKFKNSIFSGFIIGSLMGIVWVPCAGPILGSILVIAANQNTVIEGGMLLIIYSLGMIIPFLFLSGVVAKISSKVNFGGESKVRKILRIVVFALLVITGILTITGQLNLLQFS